MNIEKYYEPFCSERLFYRKLTLDDVKEWIDFFYDNPNVKYLGMNLQRSAEELSEQWIETQIKRYNEKKFGLLGVYLNTNQLLIATIGFKIIEGDSKAEIVKATLIKPKYWGQGIGMEASLAIIGKAFFHNLVDKVIGYRHIDNKNSEIFNTKLGFSDIGIFQEGNRTVVKYEIDKKTWLCKFGIYINQDQK